MSKWIDEVFTKKAVHRKTIVLEDIDQESGTTLKVFPGPEGKGLEIGAWWDGNGGEWTPEYLTITMDKEAAIRLRDHLNDWLGE